jgi:bacterioferritin (cytochrome b1)
MTIGEKLRRLLSPRTRLLKLLAETAGDAELLAAKLSRHAELCTYPNIRAGLYEVAAGESAQAAVIRQLLLDYGVSPKLSVSPSHDGSSNWERLQRDLALQVKILRSLRSQVPQWTALEPQIADSLSQVAAEEEGRIGRLRDLTLRCDPQALD